MIFAILRFAHFGSSLRVRFAHQEEIVKVPLLPPGLLALIVAKLLVAEAFERFPLPAGLAEDALLLVAHVLAAQEFLFHL
jgi:hypothetical protein